MWLQQDAESTANVWARVGRNSSHEWRVGEPEWRSDFDGGVLRDDAVGDSRKVHRDMHSLVHGSYVEGHCGHPPV